jgi:hypothetical protein
MLKNRFYIQNCQHAIVGNPKGYRTFRGAMQQAENRKGLIYVQILDAYHASKPANPNLNLVYSIRYID